MSNYTPSANFAAKDSLATGEALKKVSGTELQTEWDNLQTAVNSKFDPDTDIASTAEAVAGVNDVKVITPKKIQDWADNVAGSSAAMLEDIRQLANPGGDRLLGWDNSASEATVFTFGLGVESNGTSLKLDETSDLNVDHSSLFLNSGIGTKGGGSLEQDRTIHLDIDGLDTLACDPAVDTLAFYDDGTTVIKKNTIQHIVDSAISNANKAKTGVQSVLASTTLVDDNHLTDFNLDVDSYYRLDIQMYCAALGAGGARLALDFSDNPQSFASTGYVGFEVGTSEILDADDSSTGETVVPSGSGGVAVINMTYLFRSYAGGASTVGLQWAQGVSSGVATIFTQPSNGVLTKIA